MELDSPERLLSMSQSHDLVPTRIVGPPDRLQHLRQSLRLRNETVVLHRLVHLWDPVEQTRARVSDARDLSVSRCSSSHDL